MLAARAEPHTVFRSGLQVVRVLRVYFEHWTSHNRTYGNEKHF